MLFSQQNVSDLVRRCIAGDDAARAEFITCYSPLIEKCVALKLAALTAPRPPVRADVEDIRNDILERLLRGGCAALASLRDAGRIEAWLVTLCKNHTVDYVRKHAPRMRALEIGAEQENIASQDAPEEAAISNERVYMVTRQLESLPARERLALNLYYGQGLKYSEIAEITGQNINTVAAQIRRGKEKLKNLLEPVYNEL